MFEIYRLYPPQSFWYGCNNISAKTENEEICMMLNEEKFKMPCNIPGRVLRDISCFSRKNGIRRVILFGSRAKGTHTERSDIDLAVSGGDFDGFYWDIMENTHSLLSFDLINLDSQVSDELKKEIERDGILIYEEAR